MSLPTEPTQWTVTLAPATPASGPTLRARARRWGLTALALFAAYLIGTASADGSTASPPAPAYTTPTTVTVEPPR
ncbi:hypothetical protein [Streptomyces lavendofoliae]|uniref:Uncharacterized protein n=1 Tax=Streptomyces lavendofoliae TaxID=67314 RepID=A0A918I4M8_9ACTN|nr:hypothetical protein [Streptomyces lavendofoliae]GGU67386.1 hypothetical protein GCM10010274_64820 [Streptomyces lavendofoliae]